MASPRLTTSTWSSVVYITISCYPICGSQSIREPSTRMRSMPPSVFMDNTESACCGSSPGASLHSGRSCDIKTFVLLNRSEPCSCSTSLFRLDKSQLDNCTRYFYVYTFMTFQRRHLPLRLHCARRRLPNRRLPLHHLHPEVVLWYPYSLSSRLTLVCVQVRECLDVVRECAAE